MPYPRTHWILALGLLGCQPGADSSDPVAPAADAADAQVPSDGAPDAQVVQRGSCDAPPIARGRLDNDVAPIDFDGEPVTATVAHKLDIDAEEDGCVVAAAFSVRKADLGCELRLDFASLDARPLALVAATLSADSFCPGWSDDDEGDYTLSEGAPQLEFVDRVPDRTAERSCIGAAVARMQGEVVLRRDDGRTVRLQLDGLSVAGDFSSAGDTEATCPCAQRCGARVCGVDPVCGFSCGECSGDQVCSEAGECACAPDCAGRACGPDGCGGTCGPGCEGDTACDPQTGQCDCVPDCAGRVCGADGCGGSCAPGCDAGAACDADGQCGCAPDCEGRVCGADGCGGTCGAGCGADQDCAAGQCVDQCPDAVCPGRRIEAPGDLAALAACGHIEGDLTLTGNALAALPGVECLQTVSGTLEISWTTLEDLVLPRLTRAGTLRVMTSRVLRRVSLPRLESVDDAFGLSDLDALTTIEAPRLRTVGGSLGVGSCDALADLSGLSAVESAGSLGLDRNDLLTNVDGLEGLVALDYLGVRNNPRLQNLAGLSRIETLIHGGVILDNDALQSLRGLDAVPEMTSLLIRDNRALRSLEGLEGLRRVDSTLTIEGNRALLDTGGLSALEEVGRRLIISNNQSLTGLTLPALTTVEGLELDGLRMRDLDGLAALRSVVGLAVTGNRDLTSLDGIRNGVVRSSVRVQTNRALSQCAALAFVQRVTPPGWAGSSWVDGNLDDQPCE
jgi:hypothetical protein